MFLKATAFNSNLSSWDVGKGKTFVRASALKIADNDDAKDFELSAWPSSNDHECVPPPVLPLKQKFIDTMYSRVKENPTQSIGSLYKDVRREFSKNLSEEQKNAFFSIIPTQASISANLYAYKREFIPQQPTIFSDFDAKCPWFNLESGECTIKGDSSIGSESRIILFATNQTLRLLARASAISCDGTFKMCPKLWGQLFIVCGQLTKDIWIPLAFGFLPDKKKQTYRAFFNQLKDAMDQIGESLSAEYVMCDFEIGIRSSLRKFGLK